MTWKCLDFFTLGFPKALLKYFHQQNSPWVPVANQAIHAKNLFALLRAPHFYLGFRFLWIHAAGLFEALHSYFHFFLVLDFGVSFDGEVGEGVVEEELVDEPGTTNGTELDFLQSILFSLLMRCTGFLTAGPVVCILWPWSSQSFSKERTAGVSSRNISLIKKSNCLTYIVASSLVCTSPLAVITVVGILDVFMVCNSAELKSFLLTICILAPESTTNSLSSGSLVDAAGSTHSSAGE